MGQVRVNVDKEAWEELVARDPRYVSEARVVETGQRDAALAGTLADKAHICLQNVFGPKRDRQKKAAWRSDPLICAYFGEDALTVRQMRRTRERMQRARKRSRTGP